MTAEIAPVAETTKPMDDGAARKALVVFADGTGNAFALRETNVWRLYGATDKEGNQIARYIPGVGTSGFRLVRMIDAATGFGVPSNVRKLYRFLCWNWNPGDQIFLFGYSRGAFTVRTLAGMIGWQGLMPREIDGEPVSTADMRRNVAGAWRAYRRATTETRWAPGPTVWLTRRVRDACVRVKRRLRRQRQHADLEALVRGTPAGPVIGAGGVEGVRVDFMGLFDTVEAYGVPIEEARRIIGWLIFPLSFANRRCSPSVRAARHALAIDEERLTFAAVGFDPPKPPSDQSIKELWFAGVHGDVGGGYPDDHGAMAPLRWMAGEADRHGLRLRPGALDGLADQRFDAAPIHDSRNGLAATYRYQPRRIPECAYVAEIVAKKIRNGVDGYAPIALPDSIQEDGHEPLQGIGPGWRAAIDGQVWWRRLSSRLLLLVLLAIAAAPLLAPPTAGVPPVSLPFFGWVTPWLTGFRDLGWISLLLAAAGGTAWFANGVLRDRIRDAAVRAWAGRPPPARAGGGASPEGEAIRKLPERLLVWGILVLLALVGWLNWQRAERALFAGWQGVFAECAPGVDTLFRPEEPCHNSASIPPATDEHPHAHLAQRSGVLQVDAYEGGRPGIQNHPRQGE